MIVGLGGCRMASCSGVLGEGNAWPRSSRSGSSLGMVSARRSSSFSRNAWRWAARSLIHPADLADVLVRGKDQLFALGVADGLGFGGSQWLDPLAGVASA